MKSLDSLLTKRQNLVKQFDNDEITFEMFKLELKGIDNTISRIAQRQKDMSELRAKRATLNSAYEKGINVADELRDVNNRLNCMENGLVVIHIHNPSELELIEEADLVHSDYSFDIVPLHSHMLDSTTLQILVDEYHELQSNLKHV